MTLKDSIQKLKDNLRRFEDTRDSELLIIAQDLSATIKDRISQDGLNADGSKFPGYTPQYKKARAKAGFQTGFFDFSRTGRALANIQPRITKSGPDTQITIGAGSQENIDKLRGQVKKRGNILRPSAEELEEVRQDHLIRIQKLFDI